MRSSVYTASTVPEFPGLDPICEQRIRDAGAEFLGGLGSWRSGRALEGLCTGQGACLLAECPRYLKTPTTLYLQTPLDDPDAPSALAIRVRRGARSARYRDRKRPRSRPGQRGNSTSRGIKRGTTLRARRASEKAQGLIPMPCALMARSARPLDRDRRAGRFHVIPAKVNAVDPRFSRLRLSKSG